MSDDFKQKLSFDEMVFRYDLAIREMLDNLFTDTGWTEQEFNDASYKEMLKNAVEGTERILH